MPQCGARVASYPCGVGVGVGLGVGVGVWHAVTVAQEVCECVRFFAFFRTRGPVVVVVVNEWVLIVWDGAGGGSEEGGGVGRCEACAQDQEAARQGALDQRRHRLGRWD